MVTGTARDNVAVQSVFYQLNGTGWQPATPINLWTNWNAPVTLTPGANVLAVYAVDTSGNVSLTNTVKLDYILTDQLTVQIAGRVKLTPNYNGKFLAIGSHYTMKAAAAAGFAFDSWGGGVPAKRQPHAHLHDGFQSYAQRQFQGHRSR